MDDGNLDTYALLRQRLILDLDLRVLCSVQQLSQGLNSSPYLKVFDHYSFSTPNKKRLQVYLLHLESL